MVIVERGTRTAALQSGQLDVAFPGETGRTTMEQLKKAVPTMVFQPVAQNVSDNIIMNTKKPPFDNPKVRLAVSYAIDRRGLIQAAHQGGAVLGTAMAPKPYGVWGLLEKDLLALPGYGKAEDMKAQAKKLLGEAGITAQNPLKVEMSVRAIAIYLDMASYVINELKQVGIEATLKQIETAQWHATATRGEYQIGANLTGLGTDDPDANFYENYALRLAAQLQPVLQRGDDEGLRAPEPGAGPQEARGHGGRDPEAPRAGRAAAHPRPAARLLRALAAREGAGGAQQRVQLQPIPGRVAGQVREPGPIA